MKDLNGIHLRVLCSCFAQYSPPPAYRDYLISKDSAINRTVDQQTKEYHTRGGTNPVLNLRFVISGLTPGQIGFDLFEVPIASRYLAIMFLQTTMSFYHMNSLHLNKDQYN